MLEDRVEEKMMIEHVILSAVNWTNQEQTEQKERETKTRQTCQTGFF